MIQCNQLFLTVLFHFQPRSPFRPRRVRGQAVDLRPGAAAAEERSQANRENVAAHSQQHGAARLRRGGSSPGKTG